MAIRKFVKYLNRKMHEVGSAESYMQMSDIGNLVAKGDEVQIVDDASGADITIETLARIIYDKSLADPTAFTASELHELLVKVGRRGSGGWRKPRQIKKEAA